MGVGYEIVRYENLSCGICSIHTGIKRNSPDSL